MRVHYNPKRSIAVFMAVCMVFSIMLVAMTSHAIYFSNTDESTQEAYPVSNKIDNSYNHETIITTPENTIDSIIEKSSEVYYTVVSGDSWWSIANTYYGNGNYYKALAAYNGKNYNNNLNIGTILTIPEINDSKFQNHFANESLNDEILPSISTMYSGPKTKYKYGIRSNPAVDISIPSSDSSMKNYTDEVDTSSYESLGTYKITGYTPGCVHCCGNDKGIGAAGVKVICGYSVAAPKDIPLGTTLYIEGYGYYVVEDRGAFGNKVIDIACPTHNACGPVTATGINVYIVPNN